MLGNCQLSRRALLLFQAEDGIRDWSVTGVQTCALPISQLLDARLQSGDAQRRRSHVHAATARPQVHGHTNDSNFLRHKSVPGLRLLSAYFGESFFTSHHSRACPLQTGSLVSALKDIPGTACAGTVSLPGCAPPRKSKQPCVPAPCQIPNAARFHIAANPDTTETHPPANCARANASARNRNLECA